jgi:hypothetical protein
MSRVETFENLTRYFLHLAVDAMLIDIHCLQNTSESASRYAAPRILECCS